MPYTQLFYHLVWATKNREPLVTPDAEEMIYDLLRSKAIGLGGTVFALNGMPDHVHLVTTIPAKIAVATFVGQVKGVASTRFNKSNTRAEPLFWQEGYGAFTSDGKRLPNYIAYVERQKEHHAQGSVFCVLERSDDSTVQMLREDPASYAVEEAAWRAEMEALSLLDYASTAPSSAQKTGL